MKVFVSYSHKQRSKIDDLVAHLQTAGIKAWYDEDLTAGRWKDQLRDEIIKCDAFLFAVSDDSIKSEWCIWELVTAAENQKPVIPVIIQPVSDKIPEFISQFQMIDLQDDLESSDQLSRLVAYIKDAHILEKIKLPPKPQPEGKPERAISVGDIKDNTGIIQVGDGTTINITPPRVILAILVLLILLFGGWVILEGENAGMAIGLLPTHTSTPTATTPPTPTATATPLAGQPFEEGTLGVLVAQFIDRGTSTAIGADEDLVDQLVINDIPHLHLDYPILTRQQAQLEADFYNATLVVWADISSTSATVDFLVNTDQPLSFELDTFSARINNDIIINVPEDSSETDTSADESEQPSGNQRVSEGSQSIDRSVDFAVYVESGMDILYFVWLIEAELAYLQGDYEEAVEGYTRAEDQLQIQVTESNDFGTEIGTLLLNRGTARLRLANTSDEPAEELEYAIDDYVRATSQFPPRTREFDNSPNVLTEQYLLAQTNLAKARLELARLTDDDDTAAVYLERIIEQLGGDDGLINELISDDVKDSDITYSNADNIHIGRLYNAVGTAHLAFAQRDIAPQENLRKAIAAYRTGNDFHTDEIAPVEYRLTNFDLGLAYLELADLDIDPETNLQLALEAYDNTLETASSLNNRGVIYSRFAARGINPTENSNSALEQFEAAAVLVNSELNPALYTLIQSNLAETYVTLEALSGNLSKAIAAYEATLETLNENNNALDERIRISSNLADLHIRLGRSNIESEDNFNSAIFLYDSILEQLSADNNPQEYALILNRKGTAYIAQGRMGIKPKFSFMQALVTLERAKELITPETFPDVYLPVLENIASAYLALGDFGYILMTETADTDTDDTATFSNVYDQAEEAIYQALEIATIDKDPERFASLQNSLGLLHTRRSQVEPDNARRALERAVEIYRTALQQLNSQDHTAEYIDLNTGLGRAHYNLSFVLNRRGQLNDALVAYQEALRLISPEEDIATYTEVQLGIGRVYTQLADAGRSSFFGRDFDSNIVLAIQTYRTALDVVTPDIAPEEAYLLNVDLGLAHYRRAQTRTDDNTRLTDFPAFLYRLNLAIELGYTPTDEVVSAMGIAQDWLVDKNQPLP